MWGVAIGVGLLAWAAYEYFRRTPPPALSSRAGGGDSSPLVAPALADALKGDTMHNIVARTALPTDCHVSRRDYEDTAKWAMWWLGDTMLLEQAIERMKDMLPVATWPDYARRVLCQLGG